MARYSKSRVNITDVAELAEVSIATVSKVLNSKDDHISDETKLRVKDAAKELGYIPNDMARRLKEHNSRTLGLVVPDVSNAFPEMAQGAEDEASRRGYNVFFCSTNGNPIQEERCLKMLISKMVDGIIYVSSNIETSENLIANLLIPCVSVDRVSVKSENMGMVQIDNYEAMKEVAHFLVKNNCKKIGYVSANVEQSPCRERYKGLVDGLQECDIVFDKKLLYSGSFSVETGYMGAMSLLERENDIDCIACGNDMIAIGVMNMCRKLRLRIPQDIKVIGFDDMYIAKYLNPELTTVRQNVYDMGKVAAQMLINYVENDEPLSTAILKYDLIQRGTV